MRIARQLRRGIRFTKTPTAAVEVDADVHARPSQQPSTGLQPRHSIVYEMKRHRSASVEAADDSAPEDSGAEQTTSKRQKTKDYKMHKERETWTREEEAKFQQVFGILSNFEMGCSLDLPSPSFPFPPLALLFRLLSLAPRLGERISYLSNFIVLFIFSVPLKPPCRFDIFFSSCRARAWLTAIGRFLNRGCYVEGEKAFC